MNITLDTSTTHFNIEKLKNFGLALYAGAQENNEIKDSISESLPISFKPLVDWIDISQTNLKTIQSIATNMSFTSKLDELFSIKLNETSASEISTLTRQINNSFPILRTAETRALAQQVIVAQEKNETSIEEWASSLAAEISLGSD